MDRETLAAFLDQAVQVWQDWSTVRSKEADLEAVRHNEHAIDVPESILSRVRITKSGKAAEKVELAKLLLHDKQGPNVTVAPFGTSQQAVRDRFRVQDWLGGLLLHAEHQGTRSLDDAITEDLLIRSRAYVYVGPDPVALLANRNAGDTDYQVPIRLEWVPARQVCHEERANRLSCVWRFQDMTVDECLTQFVDQKGKPLATQLAAAVKEAGQGYFNYGLRPRDRVTVVTYATATRMTIAVLGQRLLDQPTETRTNRQDRGVDELLWDEEHGMKAVPYAFFPGRQSTADDDPIRYKGFLDEAGPLTVELDYALTQQSTITWYGAWPTVVIEKDAADNLGSGDRPQEVTLPEGGVWDGLGPGERLVAPALNNPANLSTLPETIRALEALIDLHTLGQAAYGSNNVNSGYLQAQLQAATENRLEPWEDGKGKGYTRVCELALNAARWLFRDEDIAAIPVRLTGREGTKIATLDARLADKQFDVKVTVLRRPIGGMQALTTQLGQQVDRGWLTNQQAMEQIGVRNPHLQLQEVMMERVLLSPQVQEQFNTLVGGLFQQALAQVQGPQMAQNPVIPGALASQLTSPLATARLPDPVDALGLNPPGVPNLAAESYNFAPNPQPMSDGQWQQRVVNQSYPSVGQAQSSPGGAARQSDILGRFGG